MTKQPQSFTLQPQSFKLFNLANKQPYSRRTLWRVCAAICTALLAVAVKSPQAVAHPVSFSTHDPAAAAVDSLLGESAESTAVQSAGNNVKDVQAAQNQLSSDGFPISTKVEPLRITTELRVHKVFLKPQPVIRLLPDLAPGARKVLRHGIPAVTLVTERLTKWDGIVVDAQTVGKSLMQRARPALIAVGPPRNVAEALALMKFRKLVGVFAMVATAYTADSAQNLGTGRTATGVYARYGVVAVDPRVIPLGAHLFIPGYGTAVAADTGGSIIGNRIDLCMDSLQAALSFGRQAVKVYVLSQ